MADGMTGTFQPRTSEADSGSLSDHEQTWGIEGTEASPAEPEATDEHADEVAVSDAGLAEGDRSEDRPARERDESGKFQKTPRHRARSQQASPEDVPRIRELTAKQKAAEERATKLEAELTELRARQAPNAPQGGAAGSTTTVPAAAIPQASTPSPAAPQSQTSPVPLTRAEPSEDEIGTKYKTYAEFTRDQARWVQEQFHAEQQYYHAIRAANQEFETAIKAHQDRKATYAAAHPEYGPAMAAVGDIKVFDLLNDAILHSPRSPEIEHYLATHREDLIGLNQEAGMLPRTREVAKMLQRVLESRLSPVASAQRSSSAAAGTTGAAPRTQQVPAPRPPTPVRTGPMPIGDEAPDDGASLSEHERYFKRTRR